MATPRSIDRLMPGSRVGPYLLLEPLGSGGSGRVWAVARMGQLGFSKRTVLKVMREDKLSNERARQRFEREARLGARLRHPNLRAVHELGSHEGRPFMSLSWVDTSLDELLQHAPQRRLEPSVVCWLGMQVCAALAAAHAHVNHQGEASCVVHGDVSPGNVLLTQRGHVLLADLAASDEGGSPGSRAGPSPGRFFGSIGYAAPEALRGELLDARADLFSLGCVLYEALCGAPAFEGDDERWVACQVLEQDALELRRRAPEVPAPLAAVVHRALQRSAADRFASAAAMRSALSECVPELGAYALEERSAELIQRVLGERIQQREQRMRLVFQRFSPTQLERTDTLPLAQLEPLAVSTSTLSAASAVGVGSVERAAARPRSLRLVAFGALALIVTLAALVVRQRVSSPVGAGAVQTTAARTTVAQTTTAAPTTAAPTTAAPTMAAPTTAAPTTVAAALSAAPASEEKAVGAAGPPEQLDAATVGRAAQEPEAPAARPARDVAAATPRPTVSTPHRTVSTPHRTVSTPQPAARKQRSAAPPPPAAVRDEPASPFRWRLPRNPYDKSGAPPGTDAADVAPP